MKVKTIRDLGLLLEGSVLQDCVEVTHDGVKHWKGLWSSMHGSYMMLIEQTDAKVIDGK